MEAVAMLLYIATGDLENGIKLRTMMEKSQPMLTKWTPINSMDPAEQRPSLLLSERDIQRQKGREMQRCWFRRWGRSYELL